MRDFIKKALYYPIQWLDKKTGFYQQSWFHIFSGLLIAVLLVSAPILFLLANALFLLKGYLHAMDNQWLSAGKCFLGIIAQIAFIALVFKNKQRLLKLFNKRNPGK